MHFPRRSRPACVTFNKIYRERKILAAAAGRYRRKVIVFIRNYLRLLLSAANITETVKYHHTLRLWIKCERECVVWTYSTKFNLNSLRIVVKTNRQKEKTYMYMSALCKRKHNLARRTLIQGQYRDHRVLMPYYFEACNPEFRRMAVGVLSV
jgi:hypothetical protein